MKAGKRIQHDRIRPITPRLWVQQSHLFHTNSGIFISDGAACLIDPGIAPSAVNSLARLMELRGAEPVALVITHAHWDHILGPEHFPDVPIVAHKRYPKTVRKRRSQLRKQVEKWEANEGLKRAHPFNPPQANRIFKREMNLEVDGKFLRLIHAPGHASEHIVIYHPHNATLWAGDTLSDLEIPIVSHSLVAYQETLERLTELKVHVLVPGHGTPTRNAIEIRHRFDADRVYLDELRECVSRAVAAGADAEETVDRCQAISYVNPKENGPIHRWNVESAYLELGGKGKQAIGWEQEWQV
jgi:glyoxylase-like metal-dependent hydrolase (beta-lactamase superfamily II)